MGKFASSEIHDIYSQWHFDLIKKDAKYKKLYCCDIDRLWVEVDLKGKVVVCILDLKFDDGPDGITPTEKVLYNEFKKAGFRVYQVFISYCWQRFRLVNERGEEKLLSSEGFADWLLNKRKV